MKHKHADLIHAWADGKAIERKEMYVRYEMWQKPQHVRDEWVDDENPSWDLLTEYRIKPEEKKPVVRWLWHSLTDGRPSLTSTWFMTDEEARKVSGVTDKYKVRKLEWSRTEFPE